MILNSLWPLQKHEKSEKNRENPAKSSWRWIFPFFFLALASFGGSARAQPLPEDAPIEDIVPAAKPAAPRNAASTKVRIPEKNARILEDAANENSNSNADAEIVAPSWWNVPASFAPAFMLQALASALVVALLCGYLSVFVVLKRIAFVGVALSQICSAGVALGLLWGFSPQAGAFAFLLAGVAFFAWSPDPRRVPRESYIGAVYAMAGACGVLLVALNASGEARMLDLLQGDILASETSDLVWLIGVYAVLALAHVLFQKEWVLVSFDRETANTLGFPAARWDFLLFLTIGIAIALSIRAVGALLTSALLILPGATALMFCSRLRAAFWLAPLLTFLPVVLGLHGSFVSSSNAPPSALITALLFALFLLGLGWRTWQGQRRARP